MIHIHPINQWDIVRQDNKKYLIKNHGNKMFAGWQSLQPGLGEDIVNWRESSPGEHVQPEWSIEETKEGSHKYRCV
jgi:hypothetical protein